MTSSPATDAKGIALEVLIDKVQRDFINRLAVEAERDPLAIATTSLFAILRLLVESNVDKATLMELCEHTIDNAAENWMISMETQGGIQ